LQSVLVDPSITWIIDRLYLTWFYAVACGVIWFAFVAHDSPRRKQFIWSYLAAWLLLGNVMAMFFASMGPCYYSHAVVGSGEFQPLMDNLASVNDEAGIFATRIQAWLWNGYRHSQSEFGMGISAMPSMHVSMAFLLTLAFWQSGRLLRVACLSYTLIIFVGSVHLAWHYGIDGYVAIAGTWLIWVGVGKIGARNAAQKIQ
jgi:hypothetical protein